MIRLNSDDARWGQVLRLWRLLPIALALLIVVALPAVNAYGLPCVAPPSGLVAWWPLEELTGAMVADISGGNHGTAKPAAVEAPSGPASVPGKVGDALKFASLGIPQAQVPFVQVPPSPDLAFGTGDLTVDAWVRFGSSAQAAVIVNNINSVSNAGYAFIVTMVLAFQVGNSNNVASQALSPFAGAWHHVAVTLDQTNANPALTFYVDGAHFGNRFNLSASSPFDLSNPGALFIGQPAAAAGSAFAIDELEIFNRALTPLEIREIFWQVRLASVGQTF